MTRFHGQKILQILLFLLILVGAAGAAPDPRLYSLIPPDAALLNSMSASLRQGDPDPFLLVNHFNVVDFQDFLALTGADGTLTVHQIVFVARANNDGQMNEHSLLASGHFDQPHLFKSAAGGGAVVSNYRGIPILEIQPFARERGTFKHVRWLAVLDSNVLLFGTITTTRLELDRYFSHSQTDGPLLRRLAHLRNEDQTWCLLSRSVQALATPVQQQEIYAVLEELNPELAKQAKSAKQLAIGIHYGRKVEIEYELTLASASTRDAGLDSFRQSPVEPARSGSLLATLNPTVDADALHGVMAVSMSRYKEWLSGVSARRLEQGK
jgi:hypothetical protein